MWGSRDVRWPAIGAPRRTGGPVSRRCKKTAIAGLLSADRQENRGIAERDDRAAPRTANARCARIAGHASRRPATGTQVRDGLHRGLAAVPAGSLSVARARGTDGPRPDPLAVDPATGRIRPQDAPDPTSGPRHDAGSVRAAPHPAVAGRSRARLPDAAAARQSRQRQFLSRSMRAAWSCSISRRISTSCRRTIRRSCAVAHDFLKRHGGADRRSGGPRIPADVAERAAEDVSRRRLVLPAELLLDQPEARRPLPPHSRRGEAAGRRRARAARVSRADRSRSARRRGRRSSRAARERAAADRGARARCARADARQLAGARPGGRRPQLDSRDRRARCRDREAAGVDVGRHAAG